MAEKSNDTRSRRAFAKAPPDIQKLIKQILEDERTVQHLKRRVMPSSGEGIHEVLIRRVKEAVQ